MGRHWPEEMKKPRHISGVLDSALRSINQGNLVNLIKIERNWEDIVGSALTKVSTPSALSRSQLTIEVNEPVWVDSMMYIKSQIRFKINSLFSKDIVDSVQVTLRRGSRKSGDQTAPEQKKRKMKVSESALKKLEGGLTGITDPELRSTFKKAILKSIMDNDDKLRSK